MSIHVFSVPFMPFTCSCHFLPFKIPFMSFSVGRFPKPKNYTSFRPIRKLKEHSDRASNELGNAADRSHGGYIQSSSFWVVVFARCRRLSMSFDSSANMSIHVFLVLVMSFPFMSFHSLFISLSFPFMSS